MDTMVCFASCPKERCYTMTPKIDIEWDSNIVYCGFKASYKVTLSGVIGNAIVKAFCRTNEGKLLDESEFHLNSIIYTGKMLIPFTVMAGTNIYIEILLPEYGVLCKSSCKPIHNSIPTTALYVKNKNCENVFEDLQTETVSVDLLSPCSRHSADGQKSPLPLFIDLDRKTSSFRSERMSNFKSCSFLHVSGWAKRLFDVYLKCFNV